MRRVRGAHGGRVIVGESSPPELLKRPASQPRYVSVKGEPGKATLSDVQWELRAEQLEFDGLSLARTAAEKWTAVVTSLTGVLGIVVLVKGPDDVTKVEGQIGNGFVDEHVVAVGVIVAAVAAVLSFGYVAIGRMKRGPDFVAWDEDEGSRDLRRYLARKWSRRVHAAVCVFLWVLALLVWSHVWTWETAAIVSLAAAVTLGAVAILAGGGAAYGLPYGFTPASGRLLRIKQVRKTRRARTWLRVSLVAAAAAVLLVGVAIVITWTQTPDPPPAKPAVVGPP